jgi:hypothetical protein
MVEAWWVYAAAVGGIVIGMMLFAVMTMAADEPRVEPVNPHATDALT